ncbi:ATP-binding protein [Flavihumibacter profundi]|uniref:ATP-binding protein n=1 Tax=Flavihumibacter profundi TaxID=2716883 RepID=UPI001CC670A5|nr:ATP-binding protein [Flavihumibacter profundi]MBZ5858346.1 hypothetical protein [Flavihumibacter profundi]
MVSKLIFLLLLLHTAAGSRAQLRVIDSLQHELVIAKDDTMKMVLYNSISESYAELNPDSSFYYSEQALAFTRRLKFRLEEVLSLGKMGYALINLGNFPRSLQTLLSAIAIAEDPKCEQNVLSVKYNDNDELIDRSASAYFQRLSRLGRIYQNIGILYGNANNHEKELYYYLQARQIVEPTGNTRLLSIINGTMGRVYLSLNKPDSALITVQLAYDQAVKAGFKRYFGSILLNFGRIQLALGNKQSATEFFNRAITASLEQSYLRGVVAGNLALAELYRQSGNDDSCLYYANIALKVAGDLNSPGLLLRSYKTLAAFYNSANRNDSIVKYQALIIKINDSLFNAKQVQQFQNIDFEARQRKEEIRAATNAYRNRLQVYWLISGMAVFFLVAILLWRSNRHRQKSNAILQRQKMEIEKTLAELKAAQAQLIQSEKMASLGELTAGIAHEIDNPLNFINNFSEVNRELLVEMKAEIANGNLDGANAIADDVIENAGKVINHGKRADAIVKGMLQHSQNAKGVKEPTNINALAAEYVRLAYYGLKAKDESFDADLKTNFDDSIDKIKIIPQDIGRVILNLINNAFYSVTEKKNQIGEAYEPLVSIITKRVNAGVEIIVKDNGNGIPRKVADKIFQPFFTTKPAGQGTGLGLSLSYDIIKAHGGDIKVESTEGEGAEFIIQLPIV